MDDPLDSIASWAQGDQLESLATYAQFLPVGGLTSPIVSLECFDFVADLQTVSSILFRLRVLGMTQGIDQASSV